MHMWQIAPTARQHLVRVIDDALRLGRTKGEKGAKIERLDDGTLAVSGPTQIDSAMGDPNRQPGVILDLLDVFRPATGDPDNLAALLDVSLSWLSFVVITDDTDDDGTMWFIQTPRPYPDTETDDIQDIQDADDTDS